MLAYADRVRLMPPAALGAEVARLGEAMTPAAQLQLALALGQLRQLPELIRAQELLARVLGNPEAQHLHALARLLAARYGEQRRLEEQLEKQTQQVRELQRKLDQSNERLEALKAIERSLTSRPAAPLPPARRVRPGP
jgi:predicted nuclease with TOPRIM domain